MAIFDSKTDTSKWRRWVYERLASTSPTGTELGDMTDVGDATASDRNFLIADGSEWNAEAHVQDDHSDTTITSPAQDEALVYNASTGKFENTEIALQSVTCIDGGDSSSLFPEQDVNPFGTSSPALTIQEEGVQLSNSASVLNFVGSSVTASGVGAIKTITIAAGGLTLTASDDEVLYNNGGDVDGISILTWDGTQLIHDGTAIDDMVFVEGFEIGSTDQSDRARIAPVINGQSVDLLCSSTGFCGLNFRDFAGTTFGSLNMTATNIDLFIGTERAFRSTVNAETGLYYNNVKTVQTATEANGSLEVLTTGPFTYSRVLNETDDLALNTATTAELEDNTDAINMDAAKVLGYMVTNTTTGATVFASGNGDSDDWDYYDGSTAHTPT